MRKTLIATSALAFAGAMAAAPASAADMLSVGVGGYMEQWFGYADRDDGAEGGFKNDSDAEIYFAGSLESDMGLTFGVDVQLEANNGPKEYTHPVTGTHNNPTGSTNIDESFAWVSGDFGRLEMGARDGIHARTHVGISDVGIGLNAGDTQVWIPGGYFDTSGWWVGMGDNKNIIYISPRVSGLQLGVSYGVDATDENKWSGAPTGDDNSTWSGGLNFQQQIGDTSFSFSVGHRNRSKADAEHTIFTNTAGGNDSPRTSLWHQQLAANVANIPMILGGDKVLDTRAADSTDEQPVNAVPVYTIDGTDKTQITKATSAPTDYAAVREESMRLLMAQKATMMAGDNDTFTNVGVGVGFGAFQFNVAYAERDRGGYMVVDHYMDPAAADGDASTAPTETTDDDIHTQSVVKDGKSEWDTWGVSVTYADGPMAVSLGHMNLETGAGGERTGTMFSARYSLAPGIDWRTSVFQVEDSTHWNLGGREARQDVNEGTGFVTGIRLGF